MSQPSAPLDNWFIASLDPDDAAALRPLLRRVTITLDQIEEGLARLESRKVFGKIIVRF